MSIVTVYTVQITYPYDQVSELEDQIQAEIRSALSISSPIDVIESTRSKELGSAEGIYSDVILPENQRNIRLTFGSYSVAHSIEQTLDAALSATNATVTLSNYTFDRGDADGLASLSCEPGLVYRYYRITNLSNLPNFDHYTPEYTGISSGLDITHRDTSSHYAFQFTGILEVQTTGTYTFYLTSDDGSQLLIDGTQVINNDGLHAAHTEQGSVGLNSGIHEIQVEFFERTGHEVLQLEWSGPGISREDVPADVLCHTSEQATILNTDPYDDDDDD